MWILTNLYVKYTFILLGPSLRNKYKDWIDAREKGIIPKDMLEKYDNGERIKHMTPYGEAYFSKESHEKSVEFEIDTEKSIEVCVSNLFYIV